MTAPTPAQGVFVSIYGDRVQARCPCDRLLLDRPARKGEDPYLLARVDLLSHAHYEAVSREAGACPTCAPAADPRRA